LGASAGFAAASAGFGAFAASLAASASCALGAGIAFSGLLRGFRYIGGVQKASDAIRRLGALRNNA
jgi:hypothetical protein